MAYNTWSQTTRLVAVIGVKTQINDIYDIYN